MTQLLDLKEECMWKNHKKSAEYFLKWFHFLLTYLNFNIKSSKQYHCLDRYKITSFSYQLSEIEWNPLCFFSKFGSLRSFSPWITYFICVLPRHPLSFSVNVQELATDQLALSCSIRFVLVTFSLGYSSIYMLSSFAYLYD